MTEKDNLYASGPSSAADFVFDERVARVFPDMIERSVPGYGLGLQMIGLIARRYVQQNSCVYDLGCSLGAATLAMLEMVKKPDVRFIAVDNSPFMIEHCRQHINRKGGSFSVECLLGDICQLTIENASVSVLNFTLQFIDPAQRLSLLKRIAAGTRPGGVLVLSEKIRFADAEQQDLQTQLHHDFKLSRGYSELEIAGKRSALERVLQPDTEEDHLRRLHAAGWRQSVRCFQSLNFVSWLACR